MAVWIALAGFVVVVASWVAYFATIPSGKVPLRPVGHLLAQATGGSLALGAIGSALASGHGLLATIPTGALAVTLSGLFFFLYSQRSTPVGDIRVKVGDPLRAFVALTPEGERFDSETLAGRRVLLKFFRGHW